MINLIIRG